MRGPATLPSDTAATIAYHPLPDGDNRSRTQQERQQTAAEHDRYRALCVEIEHKQSRFYGNNKGSVTLTVACLD